MRLLLSNGRELSLQEGQADEVAPLFSDVWLGTEVWPAAMALIRFIEGDAALLATLSCSRVIELGSGTGACGLAAAALGARAVVLTDKPSLLHTMCSNVTANDLELTVSCMGLEWTEELPTTLPNGGEVVLMSDCLNPVYGEKHAAGLASTLHACLSRSSQHSNSNADGSGEDGGGEDAIRLPLGLLAQTRRGDGVAEAAFFVACRDLGLQVDRSHQGSAIVTGAEPSSLAVTWRPPDQVQNDNGRVEQIVDLYTIRLGEARRQAGAHGLPVATSHADDAPVAPPRADTIDADSANAGTDDADEDGGLADVDLQRFIVSGFLTLPPSPAVPPAAHAAIATSIHACGVQEHGGPEDLRAGRRDPYGLKQLDGDAAGNNLLHAAPALRGPAFLENPSLVAALRRLLGDGYSIHPHCRGHLRQRSAKTSMWHVDAYKGLPWCSGRHHEPHWLMLMYYPQVRRAGAVEPTLMRPTSVPHPRVVMMHPPRTPCPRPLLVDRLSCARVSRLAAGDDGRHGAYPAPARVAVLPRRL